MIRRSFLQVAFGAITAAGAEERPGRFCRVTAWIEGPGNGSGEAEWKATVQGRPAEIVRVRSPKDPLLIFLVMDVAGDLTLVDPAREAAVEAIEQLPPHVWTALLRAQDGLQVLVDPTADRPSMAAGIRGLQVAGRAGLLETLEPASQLAAKVLRKSPLRIAILYLTDSNIFNYREDFTNPVINMSDTRDLSRRFPEALIREKTAKLADSAARTEAPVFIVHLSFLRDRLNEAYQTGLRRIAEASGGEALFCRSVAEIPSAVRSALDRIVTHWAIDVELPDHTPKQYNVSLTAGGHTLKQRTVFALGKK